jgi:hypothetical protein
MSDTDSSAPAAASLRASFAPTCPSPLITIRRPAISADPKVSLAQARIAASTPSAVNGLGSPEPPSPGGRPVTWRVRSRIVTRSDGEIPTSSAVM